MSTLYCLLAKIAPVAGPIGTPPNPTDVEPPINALVWPVDDVPILWPLLLVSLALYLAGLRHRNNP